MDNPFCDDPVIEDLAQTFTQLDPQPWLEHLRQGGARNTLLTAEMFGAIYVLAGGVPPTRATAHQAFQAFLFKVERIARDRA